MGLIAIAGARTFEMRQRSLCDDGAEDQAEPPIEARKDWRCGHGNSDDDEYH
jgi:hypothetical protein